MKQIVLIEEVRHQRNGGTGQGARQEKDCLSRAPRDAWKVDVARKVNGDRHESEADESSCA